MSVITRLGRSGGKAGSEGCEEGGVAWQPRQRGKRRIGVSAHEPLGLGAAEERVAVEKIVLVLEGEAKVQREFAQTLHLRGSAAARRRAEGGGGDKEVGGLVPVDIADVLGTGKLGRLAAHHAYGSLAEDGHQRRADARAPLGALREGSESKYEES